MSEKMFNIFLQSHAGSWAIMVLLFIISYIFYRQKVTGMILRLFYLIMLITGAGLLYHYSFPGLFIVKAVLAVILIGLMEMIIGRRARQERHGLFWIIWIIVLALVVSIGYGWIG